MSCFSNKLRRFLPLVVLGFLAGCQNEKGPEVSILPAETVCVLQENLAMLGSLVDCAMADDRTFVVCSGDQVILYGSDGMQQGLIGRKGRSSDEYAMPAGVGASGDAVYVWDGMSGRILVYDRSGALKNSFPAPAAAAELVPVGDDRLLVYRMNMGEDGFIDEVDAATGAVISSFGDAQAAHWVLTGWMSSAPLVSREGRVYYMPKDRLVVTEAGSGRSWEVGSGTFKVEAVQDAAALRSEKVDKYLDENSFIVSMLVRENRCYILALEGYYLPGDDWDSKMENRFYSMYELDMETGRSRCVSRFRMGDMLPHQVMPGAESFFFISCETVGEDDVYSLKRLVIG